ncbi:mucin-13 isoform X2 [Peromyscus maniculatus bairdii]|uniref:mucin-13 isoform X2 n=1 Tax=Peromyscus maniculatus bairdii TaxID=230844 RepID=UPI003FD1243E
MKASLLLSLGLLLVLLAASASSVLSSTATQSTSPAAQTPTTTEPTNTTAQTPTTTEPTNTTAQTPTATESTNTTAQTPTATESTNTTAQTPTATESTNTTAQTPTATEPTNTTAQTPTATESTNTTAQTPTATESTNTTAQTPTATESTNTTAQTPTATESTNTTAQTPTATESDNNSTLTPTTTESDNNSTLTSGTTQSPSVSSQTTTPGPRDPCVIDPCKGTASCVNLHSERVCLCLEGYYYKTSSCEKGKTFPGELTVKAPESSDLEDKNSKGYQDFHNYIVSFLKNTFNKPGDGYGQTIILKVSDSSSLSARSAMRAAQKTVYVSVVNMFEESTTQNESTVAAAIDRAVQSNGNMTGYTRQDLCDYYGCEKDQNNCQNGFQCKCKPGLARPNLLIPFCFPQECPETCKAEDKKQCIIKNNGALECVCMPGYQKTTDEKCEECPFGYSGMDCKDQFQLILTIVGTIAGALILILLIALIVSASSKKKKKDMEEQNLIDNDFHNVRMQQTGFSNSSFSNFGADNSIFPKVRTGTPKQTQNPYGNQRSMPHPDY